MSRIRVFTLAIAASLIFVSLGIGFLPSSSHAQSDIYLGEFVSQNFQSMMIAGTTQRVQIQIKNRGTAAWDSNTKIAAFPIDQESSFYDPSWLDPHRIASSGVVQPGAIGTFDFIIGTPTLPGNYTLEFAFVQEGVAWFARPAPASISFPIFVMAPVSAAAQPNVVSAFEYLPNRNTVYCMTDQSALTSWANFAGSTEYAVAGLISPQGTIHGFVRGMNGALWHRQGDNTTMSTWENLGGQQQGAPVATAMDSGRMDVFVRGMNNAIFQRTWNGSAWEPWANLGGVASTPPAAIASGSNRIDLFIRDESGVPQHRWWDGTWHDWESLGGHIQGAPVAIVTGSGRMDVFARGMADTVYQRTWNGTVWEPWVDLGGSTSFIPSATSWGSNRIDLFIRGADETLQHRMWDGTWHAWESLNGQVVGPPAAVSQGQDRLSVFVRGKNAGIWKRVWDGVQWQAWEKSCTVTPTGHITAPVSGAQIGSSAVAITATAQDFSGGNNIAYVDFLVYYNGAWFPIGHDTSAPYTATWQPPTDLKTQAIYFTIHVVDTSGNVNWNPGGYLPASFISNAGQENWVTTRVYLNQRALGTNGGSMCSSASIAMIRASAGLIGSDYASLKAEATRAWNTTGAPGVGKVRDYLNNNGMRAAVIWNQNKDIHWNKIKQEIIAGRPVILDSNSNGGNLTSFGHYIVVVGYRENANPVLRQIIAYDPYGAWTGVKGGYNENTKNLDEHDTPNSMIGRFVYYTFANLGTIYSITAQRIAPAMADITPSSLADEIYPFDTSDVTTYIGDGHISDAPTVSVYLPVIQR